MSRKDYSTTEPGNIPLWINHENITFQSNAEMLSWVSNDKINFSLSDKVYDAMVDCLKESIDAIIVATIVVNHETHIDVMIRRDNFQKILSSYVERLLTTERYEKLALVKSQVTKYGLEMS
jgi:hypothetical protein